MVSGQLSVEGLRVVGDIQSDLETDGFAWVDHGIAPEAIDELIQAYARFTDNLPNPSLETVNAMIPAGFEPKKLEKQLDDLDYSQDQESEWHKYKTNYQSFAKPGGYTNRSLQVQALAEVRGVRIDDDPKEFYHFHPSNTVRMNEMRLKHGWPNLPPEVHELHMAFMPIHRLGAAAIKKVYSALEDSHPELLPTHFGPKDVQASPVRLLFYHPNQGKVLARGHYDKAMSTLQIAESHLGLWIKDPQTGKIVRNVDRGAFFAGKMFSDQEIGMYPESVVRPGWHGVNLDETLSEGRRIHGNNVSRWAIIFFANSINAGTVLDKSLTHTEVSEAIAQ